MDDGGFMFEVHRTTERVLAFLQFSPLAFLDSLWLETHLPLLRAAPARALALFDHVAGGLQTDLERANFFPTDGQPMRSAVSGVPMSGPRDAAGFVRRRRELLANALASPTLGVRAQMHACEADIQKHR